MDTIDVDQKKWTGKEIKNCLANFIDDVIAPLQTVFGFHDKKICILYDPESHTVAFNLQRTIYLNLEYYERNQCNGTAISSVLLSWFFTLAHEFTVRTFDSVLALY